MLSFLSGKIKAGYCSLEPRPMQIKMNHLNTQADRSFPEMPDSLGISRNDLPFMLESLCKWTHARYAALALPPLQESKEPEIFFSAPRETMHTDLLQRMKECILQSSRKGRVLPFLKVDSRDMAVAHAPPGKSPL